MGDKGDGGEHGQPQAAADPEPEAAQDDGEITEPPVGVVIKNEIAGGKEMEQADGDDREEQG